MNTKEITRNTMECKGTDATIFYLIRPSLHRSAMKAAVQHAQQLPFRQHEQQVLASLHLTRAPRRRLQAQLESPEGITVHFYRDNQKELWMAIDNTAVRKKIRNVKGDDCESKLCALLKLQRHAFAQQIFRFYYGVSDEKEVAYFCFESTDPKKTMQQKCARWNVTEERRSNLTRVASFQSVGKAKQASSRRGSTRATAAVPCAC